MKKLLLAAAILLALTSLIFLRCTKNIAGGTEVGNPSVAAMLYEPDGTTPAVGAKVKFYPVDNNPFPALHKTSAAIESTITDANGRYSISTVTSGTYNIIGNKDGNKSILDSINISPTTPSIPADTLLPTGSIKGVVRLRPEHSSTNVYILIFGTNTFTSPVDSIGNFTLDSMAGGTYRVKILTTIPNYMPLDTSFTIRAGKRDTLADTIRLKYTGIPVVMGLKLSYDTMKQIVTLTWSKADTALVKSYNVYRRNVDSNTVAVRINASPVADTVYRDSTGVQDQTYEYRVAAVNKSATEGTKSAAITVKAIGMFSLVRTWGSLGSAPGEMNNPVAITADSRGLLYVADENNNRIQVFDSTGQFMREFGDSILLQPCDIALQDSFLFVATNGDKKINKLTLTGHLLAQFALPANASFPHLAADSSENIYLIPTATDGKIQVYDSSGLVTEYHIIGDYLWGIRRMDDQLFCFNGRDSLMQVFSLGGVSQTTIVLGPGKYPVAITGSKDTIMVLNGGRHVSGVGVIGIEVLVFNSNFQYLGRWGRNVDFTSACDMTLDENGNVYVLDQDARKIRKFTRQ